jgi:putative addiction module component (TIGR02574 family)
VLVLVPVLHPVTSLRIVIPHSSFVIPPSCPLVIHESRVEIPIYAGYPSAMSLTEILDEIPRLTPEQRRQVVEKVLEFEGDWLDSDDTLSPEEKHLLESRLAAHDKDPTSAVPWEEAKERLKARFVR